MQDGANTFNPKVIHNGTYTKLLELRDNPEDYELLRECFDIFRNLTDYEKARLFDIMLTSDTAIVELAIAFEIFTVNQ